MFQLIMHIEQVIDKGHYQKHLHVIWQNKVMLSFHFYHQHNTWNQVDNKKHTQHAYMHVYNVWIDN